MNLIIESKREIAAAPSLVWHVSEDVQNWPDWTPTVETIERLDEGPFEVGSTAQIKQPGLPAAVWRVTALSRGTSFTWETDLHGMRLVATHQMAPSREGTTSVLKLQVLGIVGLLLWPMISRKIRKAIDLENACLKAECEARQEYS